MSNDFPASIGDHYVAFKKLYGLYTTLMFLNVQPTLDSGYKSYLVTVHNSFICWWVQFANNLLRIFVSIFVRDIYNFLSDDFV